MLRNISPRWPQCTSHPERNVHIHDNGPTLPRHPATAHGHLYVGLLPTNAQPNEGHSEIGLTMQSAGPIREPWQAVELEFQFKGSEFGLWKVKGGRDAFAFRHPSLGRTDVYRLLESEVHHYKISPVVPVDLLQWLESLMPQPKMPGICRSYLVWYSPSRRAHARTKMNYLLPGYTDSAIPKLSK